MPVTAHDLADIAADKLTHLGQGRAAAVKIPASRVLEQEAARRALLDGYVETLGALDRLGDRLTYGSIDREMARTHANLVAVASAAECKGMADYWRAFAASAS